MAAMLLCGSLIAAQEVRSMTADEVMALALQNHQQLKLSEKNIYISKQQTEVSKLQKLPTITASTSQFYLGNALIIDKDFSNSTNVAMPHYGSSYGVQASQLIFKGGLVKNLLKWQVSVSSLQNWILRKPAGCKVPGTIQLFRCL